MLTLLEGVIGKAEDHKHNAGHPQAPPCNSGWKPEAPPALWINALTLLEGVCGIALNVAGSATTPS